MNGAYNFSKSSRLGAAGMTSTHIASFFVFKDFEATIASATTWIYTASIQLLIRRLSFV